MAKENGLANGSLNGHSLASLSGQTLHTKTVEHHQFDFSRSSLEAVLKAIRELGQSGQLTINVCNGYPRGPAEWKTTKAED